MRKGLLSCAAVAATIALGVPLIATADHKPGHGKGPGGGNAELTIVVEPDTVRWGRSVTISGRLRGPDRARKTIDLQQNPHPYPGPFKTVATATTDDQGDYSFRIAPAEHTKYRVVAKLQGASDVTSGEALALVRMRVTRRVDDHTPRRRQTVTFTGTVKPEHDGRTVYIQRRRADGAWRTKATTRLVDAGAAKPNASAYSRDLRIYRDGVYRALVRADANHLGNKSRRVRLDVP